MQISKNNFFLQLFFSTRLYMLFGANILLFVLAYFFPVLLTVAIFCVFALLLVLLVDLVLLMFKPKACSVNRKVSQRLSNGDDNKVVLTLRNEYGFAVSYLIIEELPVQLQKDLEFKGKIAGGKTEEIEYIIRPVERGVYNFGNTNIFVQSALGLVTRRFICENNQDVKVYPSFLQLRQYELIGHQQFLNESGSHIRKVTGHSVEFDHIKPYTKGDDVRTLNWKATARTGNLMVNNYLEEKSQQVYSVIDKGRNMKMPFNGLSLLDYAINASLVFSNIAVAKGDKAGIVTFTESSASILSASNKKVQMSKILETLYAQETQWQESDYESLSVQLRSHLSTRSLLMLYTNFESMTSLQRQLPYLRRLARYHLVLVIFFENTELKKLTADRAATIEEVYKQTIAQKFVYDKKLMVKELSRYGILSLLSAPEQLTVNVVNKYLELKSRMLI
ncbi:uncharacterized protein (DUF58 family) [Chitinophaga terrae (ex Kim and Jung 2007)]|uniref:DUF58 domain-containing protein n=1 Tax=Chitinophaga terrae (ex Kim and Jung 2007) TaxID=408074 RepID=UPI00277E3509|nr:DUF58 domain-containing protein [Chitinophaga terrae (ex Kim and Jung 2007)]MDQ0106012.1 uncharacterized protein (DUF58 family) [Chitinophaga terrae (ex Kim and Jung 2007)]